MAEKVPAFQFYPRDYLSDAHVSAMTYEQQGIYWRLCAYCWLEGSLPSNEEDLAAILSLPVAHLRKLWSRIAICFTEADGRLRHGRLDEERAKQAESKARRQAAAGKRWADSQQNNAHALHQQSISDESAKQCSSSSSSSSSATAVSTPTPGPTLIDRSGHKAHALCGRVCLPAFLLHEFVRLHGGDEAEARAYVGVWWTRIDDELAQGHAPIGDAVRYLKARWEADHPTPKPKARSPTEDVIARFVAAGGAS